MTAIAQRRCVRHADREAVARCVECQRDFCRECIVEYDGMLLCPACLARRTPAGAADGGARWRDILITCSNVVLAIAVFYLLGKLLALLPHPHRDEDTSSERGSI